jgi:hypothetical protein
MTDGCTAKRAAVGVDFCNAHLSEPRRCSRVKTDGERCKKAAVRGLRVCRSHGGATKVAKAKSTKSVALTAMQRFATPYVGDIDPLSVFELEFRRTLGRISWLDHQISLLESEEDLIWQKTKTEQISATEFAGTNTTYESKIHLYVEMQNWERKHLLDMEKVWIGAKLDEQKLNLMKRYVEASYMAVLRAVKALGLDPSDPKVQEALSAALLDEQDDRGVPALPTPH